MKFSKRSAKTKTDNTPAQPKKQKELKPSKVTRFILTIGDEGAILMHVKRGTVEGRWFAADPSPQHVEVFERAVTANQRVPILILLDTMDQTYVQQSLPPVSKMSVKGLVKRRLKREFGNIELKSSYFMGRDKNSREWNYMLFAFEQPDYLKEWLGWVASQPNQCLGIRSLLLELPPIIERLYAAMPKTHEGGHEWKFLVTHNKVSGFRQVVLRNGKMMFTRLGQSLTGGPDVEAGLIEQEVSSTLEYLKRMGLKGPEHLALTILVGQEIKPLIDPEKIRVDATQVLTPHEAAVILSIPDTAQANDRFGDIVLGVATSQLRKAHTVLWTAPLAKIHQLHSMFPLVRSMAAVGMLGLLYFIGDAGYTMWTAKEAAEMNQSRKNAVIQETESLKAADDLSIREMDKIIDAADVFQTIIGKAITPRQFLLNASAGVNALEGRPRVISMEWVTPDAVSSSIPNAPVVIPSPKNNTPTPAAEEIPDGKVPVAVHGYLDFNYAIPANIKHEVLQAHLAKMTAAMQPYFKGYTLTVGDIPGMQRPTEILSLDFKETSQAEEPALQPIVLKINFTGTDYVTLPNILKPLQ